MSIPVTVAYGDGDSPEYLEAALYVLRETGVSITVEAIEIGKRIYDMQHPTGILPSAFDTLYRSRILIKGRTMQPPQDSYRDVSEVIRTQFGLTDEHKRLSIDPRVSMYANDAFTLFETVEDSAAAMIMAGAALLDHLGEQEKAHRIREALAAALAKGLPAKPLMERLLGSEKSGSMLLAEAVCARLNAGPEAATS